MGKKVIIATRSGYLLDDLDKPFYRKYVGYLFSKVDIILCQGRSWKEKVITIYPKVDESKFFVRMNWIDDYIYHQPERSIEMKSEVIKISFIGWVEKTKGVEDLIYAMHELRNENISLTIAGNGAYFQDAEKLIDFLDLDEKIALVGWIREKAKLSLLAQSDIFVLPSHFEGMPNAVLEAMAAGLPIVATNVGGIPDMINENQSGILIRPGEKKQLADGIRVLIDNPMKRKTMGENAKLSVHRHHSIGSAVKDFETIILN